MLINSFELETTSGTLAGAGAACYAALNEVDWVIYDCQRQSNKRNSAKEPSCCGAIETTNGTFAGAGFKIILCSYQTNRFYFFCNL